MSRVDPQRHKHHLLLPELGAQGQERLANARVLMIGAGGLGCPILAYLAGAGVGHITICDGDVVELSNLQRQLLYSESDVGTPKAKAASLRLQTMNSTIRVKAHPHMVSTETGRSLFQDADLVIEGTDRIAARHLVNKACLETKRPLLSAAASRFEGQVMLLKPGQAGHPCYACLVPEDAEEEGLCDRDGVLGPVVGTVGSIAATEAIKYLAGIKPTLERSMLIAHLKAGTVRRTALTKDPACPCCTVQA